MADLRTLIRDQMDRAGSPSYSFGDLGRRRDRKRRNQRITAGVVGIAVFLVAVWTVMSVRSLDRSDTSVVPAVSGTTGPAETGPAETGPGAPVRDLQTDYLLDLETGETTPLPEGIRGDWQNAYAISPDGSEVAYYGEGADADNFGSWAEYFGQASRALLVAHTDGTHVRQIADDAFVVGGGFSSDMGPAWSPDGTKIAYVGRPSQDVESNIFVVDLASGVNKQVTFETVPVSGTAYSPDGSSIVYTAYLPDGSEVRIAPAAGGEGSTLVGGHGSSASGASFSPDGSLLTYICADPPFDPSAGPTPNRDLCLANADGSDPRVIAQAPPRKLQPPDVAGIVTASWSPDGSRLAFWTFYGVEGVYILDLATGQTTCVASCSGAYPIPAWPRWLDDHTLIVESYHGPH